MEKVIKDGKVAVLVSPGYGAGWSTWSSEHKEYLCMDADIVNAVLAGDREKAAKIVEEKFPEIYTGGAEDLVVEWIPQGTVFLITEYDGSETLHVQSDPDYMIA